MKFNRLLKALAIPLIAVLPGAFGQPAAAAERIVNTAKATWSDAGGPRTTDSNLSAIDV